MVMVFDEVNLKIGLASFTSHLLSKSISRLRTTTELWEILLLELAFTQCFLPAVLGMGPIHLPITYEQTAYLTLRQQEESREERKGSESMVVCFVER